MNKELDSLINKAADALKTLGASEVYLFGSTARGTAGESSDVDLAVSGLPPEVFFKAMGRARRFLRRPVDLVDLDDSTPFNEYLRSSGELKRVA